MAPANKRKSDAPVHESRLDYDQRPSAEENAGFGGGGGGGGSFGRADPATLASRRTVAVSGPATSAGGAAGGAGGSAARKYRRQKYLHELVVLNTEFAEWAEKERKKLSDRIESEQDSDDDPAVFFLGATAEYRRRARALTAKYSLEFGDVLTFGTGDCGQLGWPEEELNANATFKRPQVVTNLRGRRIVQVVCGGLHNIALSEDGKVYTWGQNDDGSLGQFTFDPNVEQVGTSYVPGMVTGFVPSPKPSNLSRYDDRKDEIITMVAAGDVHTLGLSSTGNVYFWGAYKDKEGKTFRDLPPSDDTRLEYEVNLRTAEEIDEQKFPPKPPKGKQRWPIHVSRLPGKAVFIDCGLCMNAAMLDTSTGGPDLVTWGMGECGELGRPMPQTRTGEEYDMGAVDAYLKPAPPIFSGPALRRTVESVACGGYHLLVVVREFEDAAVNGNGDGDAGTLAVYTSGANNYGQLGRGDPKNERTNDSLVRVDALDGCNITKVAGGTHHSMAVDGSGTNLYGWGRMDSGQLGTSSTLAEPGAFEDRPVPVTLRRDEGGNALLPNPVIVQISCGANHNLVLTDGGEVYTWGYGDMSALGHGRERDEMRPRRLLHMGGIVRQAEKAVKDAKAAEEWKAMTEEERKAATKVKEDAKKKKQEEEEKMTEKEREAAKEAKKKAKEAEDVRFDRVARQAESSATVQQVSGGGQHSAIIVTRSVGP